MMVWYRETALTRQTGASSSQAGKFNNLQDRERQRERERERERERISSGILNPYYGTRTSVRQLSKV